MEQRDLHAGCEDTQSFVCGRQVMQRSPGHEEKLIADILCLRCLEAFTKSSSVEYISIKEESSAQDYVIAHRESVIVDTQRWGSGGTNWPQGKRTRSLCWKRCGLGTVSKVGKTRGRRGQHRKADVKMKSGRYL